MCVCMCVCVPTEDRRGHCLQHAHGSSQVLKLQVVASCRMWMLGTRLEPSGKPAKILKHSATSITPKGTCCLLFYVYVYMPESLYVYQKAMSDHLELELQAAVSHQYGC